MKKPILAMTLALTLACGSFLGFLPGNSTLVVEAAEAGTVSGVDAEATEVQLNAPTDLVWTEIATGTVWYGGKFSENNGLFVAVPSFVDTNPSVECQFEVEIYRGDVMVKSSINSPGGGTTPDGYIRVLEAVNGYHWDDEKGEAVLTYGFLGGITEDGLYRFRVRAVSADGESYSEWSDFSGEFDSRKETFLAARGLGGG